MGPFFEQIFNLLTAPPGNLIYHLVVVFSLAGGFQAAAYHYRASEFPQLRRTVIGLGLLLLVQISLFLVSGLGWQGLVDPLRILPPIDRAMLALSLVWVIWLWAFPEPGRTADAATLLLSVLVVTAMTLGLASWLTGAAQPFNLTFQNSLWHMAALALIVLGGILLGIRQPNGWGNGIAFLGLAFLGHLVALFGDSSAGSFSGAARLAYLAAYPLLMTLPQRYPAPSTMTAPRQTVRRSVTSRADVKSQPVPAGEADSGDRRRGSTDPKTFHALLDLAGELNAARISHLLTRAVAQTMLADLTFLFYLTEDKNQLVLASGYDLIREESLEGTTIDKSAIPLLANAMQRGRPLRLPASGTSPDLKALGDLLGLSNPGHLMHVPILTPDKEPLGGLLLLSPYSDRLWNADDQTFLANISSSLVPVIERGQRLTTLEGRFESMESTIEAARAQVEALSAKNTELTKQLEAALQESDRGQEQAQNLAALLAVQEESQQTIQQLQQENDALRASVSSTSGPDLSHYETELRQTLKEVARLQNQLAQANARIVELEKEGGSRPSDQAEVVASISQELRQPMSSIVGYTDLLLGESVGILGALQRKFVERIKASTERIGALIDDLIQITTLESGLAELKPEAIDLNLIIDNAMAYTSSQVREKNIALHLDLPQSMPPIQADREAVQQILIHLLQNARAATPMEGTITLRVQTTAEDGRNFIMLQVSDTGGGISSDDLPRVFSRLYRADNVLIQGVGDTGVGLSIAKTLTEAQHGRIWVESEPGVGATFSVLLPIAGNGAEGK